MKRMTEKEFRERMDRIRSDLRSVGAFEDMSPQAKAERKRRGKTDIFFFAQTYFPRMFYLPFEDVDTEVIEMAYVPDILVPVDVFRGYAKSTFFSFLVPIHEAAYPELHNMHFFVSCSLTELQATSFTGPIMLNLQENERLCSDFGNLFKAGSESDFETVNDQRFLARGYKQRVRGIRYQGIYRPDRCTIDDLEDLDTIRNPRIVKNQIQRVKRSLMPAMSDEGHFLTLVGNNLGKKSVMAYFLDMEEEDKPGTKKYPSYTLRVLDSEGLPTCPKRFPMRKIDAKRHALGTHTFNQEMLGLLDDESDAFQEAWFRYFKSEDIVGVPLRVCVGVDSSLEEGATHDYRAIIATGIDSQLKIYVLRAWIRKASENTMWEALWRILKDLAPSPVAKPGMPQIQGTRLIIAGAVTEKHLKDHWQSYCRKKGSCPAYPGFELQQTNKISRIVDTLSHPFETGNILLAWPISEDTALLKEQLLYIDTPSVNDDGPDALQVAVSNLTAGPGKFEYHSIEKSRYADMRI